MSTATVSQRIRRLTWLLGLVGISLTLGVLCQAQTSQNRAGIPQNATALEGLPQVRIDTTKAGTTRRELDAAESAKSRVRIRIVNGRFYDGERMDRPLIVTSAGEFTYLSSTEPGKYVRFRRLNDTLTYVEHIDKDLGSVTYWGELRIVLGN